MACQARAATGVRRDEHFFVGATWSESTMHGALAPPIYSDISAGVLVGGRGERMGGLDKAMLTTPTGEAFLSRTIAWLRPTVSEVLLVGRSTQQPLELDLGWVTDVPPDVGPMGGLHALLHRVTQPWLLLVACDLPQLRPEILSMLASHRQPGHLVVVPRTSSGLEPLCALYHVGVRDRVRHAIERRDLSLRRTIEACPRAEVEIPTQLQACFLNVNTPDALGRLKR